MRPLLSCCHPSVRPLASSRLQRSSKRDRMRPTSTYARMLAVRPRQGSPFDRLTLQHRGKWKLIIFNSPFPLPQYSNANGAESCAATERPTSVKTKMKGSGSPLLELHRMSHRFSTKRLGDRAVDLKRPDGSERPGSEFPTGLY